MRKSILLLFALLVLSIAARASPDRARFLCLSNVDGGDWDPQNLDAVTRILQFQGISASNGITIRSTPDANCDLVLALHNTPYISDATVLDGRSKEVILKGGNSNGLGDFLWKLFTGPCLVKAAGFNGGLPWRQQLAGANIFVAHTFESLADAVNCDIILVFKASIPDLVNAKYEADILDGPTKTLLKRIDRQEDFFRSLERSLSEDVLKQEREAAAKAAAAAAQTRTAASTSAEPSEEVLKRVAEAAARRATEEAERRQAAASPPATQARQTKAVLSDVDRPKYHDAARPADVALVVGIEKYNDIPNAEFAERDATAVRDHLLALGFAPRNVLLLTGSRASRTGIATAIERRLPSMVKPESVVFFYYSGHGAPDPETGKAYLLPADGDPQYLEDSGYALPRLYAKLGALKAKRVLVALDACFSGAGGRSVLPQGMRPLVTKIDEGVIPAKVTSLTASGAKEISGSLPDQGHGIFTYYLLKGLSGGRRSFQAIFEYVKPNVEDAARLQNHSQSPVLAGPDAAF